MTTPLTAAELRGIEDQSDRAHLSPNADVYDGVWSFARQDVPRLIATVKALADATQMAYTVLHPPCRDPEAARVKALRILRTVLVDGYGVSHEAQLRIYEAVRAAVEGG